MKYVPSITGRIEMWLCLTSVVLLAGVLETLAAGSRTQGKAHLVAYRIVNRAIPQPLTDQPGHPERGRRIVLDREGGDCIICHAMPLPQRRFHGNIGPPLDGVGSRYTTGELRLRVVDPSVINPETIMPAYYKARGRHRVLDRYRHKPILTAQQIEDVVAYLLTLKSE
jgi:L-cysteine S-thiosulfotransferase